MNNSINLLPTIKPSQLESEVAGKLQIVSIITMSIVAMLSLTLFLLTQFDITVPQLEKQKSDTKNAFFPQQQKALKLYLLKNRLDEISSVLKSRSNLDQI